MPGLCGDEFLRRARKISRATRILITGYTDWDALVRAINHGQIYAYVSKPWDPTDLRIKVAKAVEHYHLTIELSRERDLFHALFDNTPDSIYFKDTAGRYTRVNQSHANVLGVHVPQKMIGKTDFDFLPEEVARQSEVEEKEIMDSWRPVTDKVTKIRNPGGAVCWYSTTKVPIIDMAHRVTGLAGISREITERKKDEEALARQAQELAAYNAELEQFAYLAAHDLQEPLRTVASFTQLLALRYKGKLDSEADKFIGFAVEGAARMRRLIDDLLAYSRVARRQNDMQPAACGALFQQSLDNLRAAIEESGATITSDPLPTVMADPGRLAQVFQNLLGNAIKFRSQQPPHIHVSAEQQGTDWVFSVRDNGIGIDPQYAARIFQVFERLHGKQEYPGTGIGLALCKRIVERHGGRIWVESAAGEGATFRFTIPG